LEQEFDTDKGIQQHHPRSAGEEQIDRSPHQIFVLLIDSPAQCRMQLIDKTGMEMPDS
jgi:hypothetical protein